MALVTTVGSATANSFATVEAADTYIASRFMDADDDWVSLSTANKETRLTVAAHLLGSLPFRGIKATVAQALVWPRLFPRDALFGRGTYGGSGLYRTYADITTRATALEVDPPTIPQEVKDAQIEVAFQVVHKSLMSMAVGQTATTPQQALKSVSVSGGLSVTLAEGASDAHKAVAGYLGGKSLTSLVYIDALLTKYLTMARWRTA